MKWFFLGISLWISVSATAQERELGYFEKILTSETIVGHFLRARRLDDISAREVSNLARGIFRNHNSMSDYARFNGCQRYVDDAALARDPGAGSSADCVCTNQPERFKAHVAHRVHPTIGVKPDQLFREYQMKYKAEPMNLMLTTLPVPTGGERMSVLIGFRGVTLGKNANQLHCNMKGRYRLYTSTINALSRYIEVDVDRMMEVLKGSAPLALDRVSIARGAISYK